MIRASAARASAGQSDLCERGTNHNVRAATIAVETTMNQTKNARPLDPGVAETIRPVRTKATMPETIAVRRQLRMVVIT